MSKYVYIAHPYNSPLDQEREYNRSNAAAWVAWLCRHFDIVPIADWIILTGQFNEQEGRAMGLAIDKLLVERCEEIWLVGGRISEGMEIERSHAESKGVVIRDLTSFGYRSPNRLASFPIDRFAEVVEMKPSPWHERFTPMVKTDNVIPLAKTNE